MSAVKVATPFTSAPASVPDPSHVVSKLGKAPLAGKTLFLVVSCIDPIFSPSMLSLLVAKSVQILSYLLT
jgi:hypothetical protein